MNRKDIVIGIAGLVAGCSGGGVPAATPAGAPSLRSLLAAGGSVTLPAKTFVVDDPPLNIARGTVLRGAGIGQTVVYYTGTTHLIVDADDVTISDLTLDGSLCPPANPLLNCCGWPGCALVLLESNVVTLRRVRIQSAPAFGVFALGDSLTVQDCQFDDCGRTYGEDTLGGGARPGETHSVFYDGNVFSNCHGNAIDNCQTRGTWSNNTVLSIAQSVITQSAGDIIADGGSTVVIKKNTLLAGAIQVYGATSGCLDSSGEPQGCQVLDNVIKTGTLCNTPLCPGLYLVPGNVHHGNVIAGVLVD